MLRVIILILILAILALIAAVATGFLDITQTRGAKVPEISTVDNGVSARGGQSPAFDVETGTVSVGTTRTNVVVPTVEVNPPQSGQQQPAGNTASNTAR